MAKKGLKDFDTSKKKNPNKFIGAVKPTGKTKSSKAQNIARYTNVWNKANANTELGKKIRGMLYDMTKDKNYLEKNYIKNDVAGIHYTKSEIRASLSFAKTKALVNAKKQHKRLQTIQKRTNHIPSYTEFRKDNPKFTRSKVDVKKAHRAYNKLVKEQKKKNLRKTSFKDFKQANPHLVNPLAGFDSADIEAFYDS